MDALAILIAAGKPVNFLARADIFRSPNIARLLTFLKISPVYRPRDGVDILGKNAEVFKKVSQMLTSGESIGIMPEGAHTHLKHLQQLKKGICRIVFEAAAVTNYKLDTMIVPVGLDYSNYHIQGSQLLIIFGEPIRTADYYQLYQEEPNRAVSILRDKLSDSLRRLMIDVKHTEEYPFIINYAKWLVRSQNRNTTDPFDEFYKINEEVDSLNILKTKDPEGFASLKEQYIHLTGNPDLPKSKTSISKKIKRLAEKTGLVISLSGYMLNFPPFLLSKYLSGKVKDPQFIGSIKYGSAILLFPVWFLILFIISIFAVNLLTALVVLLILSGTAIYSLKRPLN